jgi:hypothetical protein
MICFSTESAEAFLLSGDSAHALIELITMLRRKWIPELPFANITKDGEPRN